MTDIRTGREMTRREFGTGLAAILATGAAPAIAGGRARRGLGMRCGMMGGGGGGTYPWDYRIAYLETAKTISQWIVFGLYADDATSGVKFNGKVLFNSLNPASPSASYGPYLFGGYGTNGAGFTCQTGSYYVDHLWMFRYGANPNYAYNSEQLSENTEYTVEAYYSPTSSYLKQDGTTVISKSTGGSYSHVVVPLFCVWNAGSILERLTYIRMIGAWSFEKGGTLYRNLIPCVKNGVVCVYDTVTKTFYYNAGTGSLTAGPRVADDGSALT